MSDKGAHFYRCDFQVHSPRDINWSGGDFVTEEERADYAKSLVAACRKIGLQSIAITDHHDMAFVEYIRKAAADETDEEGKPLPAADRLIVFPGMELTLGVPCQALLIFDADLPADIFQLATNALALTVNPATESKTAQTERIAKIENLNQLKEALDAHTFLRNRYVVLPNVTNEGKSSILRDGFPGKYKDMPCVGGYVDGDISKLKPGNKSKIDGKEKAWGNKRIACFQTSDNRSADHKDLGRVSTWVKWAIPTAEALRQACLAQESRVLQTAPQLPSVLVDSISISNSAFLGPVELAFNPQYNALIGGRGTGKSTILEYLRWALCDQPPGITDEDSPNYQARRARLIDLTLKPHNATVEVRFQVNGVPHLVRRKSQDGSLLIKVANDQLRPCTEDEVRTLLPIQAYSQKQLSDVSVRVEELSRFVNAPIRAELQSLERQIDDSAARIRQSYGLRQRHKLLTQTIQQRSLEQTSLTGQANAIRDSLTGVTDEDRAILDNGPLYDAADRQAQTWRDHTLAVKNGVNEVLKFIASYLAEKPVIAESPEGETLRKAYAEYSSLLLTSQTALDSVILQANDILKKPEDLDPSSPWRQWTEKAIAFRASYNAALERSSAHSEKLQQLKAIEDQLNRHIRETGRLKDELATMANGDTAYNAERLKWEALLKQRDDLLAAQCESLTQSSGGAIRARVRRHADSSEFVAALRQALSGSRVQGNKIDGVGDAIKGATDPGAFWTAVLSELEKLADIDADKDGTEKKPATPTLVAAGLTSGDADRIAKGMNAEEWLKLSLIPIKSAPIFEYRAREEEYIPFHNASAGQQATALLKTLLNEAGAPLIIDQPEEDLDNPVMLEIVKQVWQAKQKRQILFASHNANLVVNGDAELVVWCDYRTTGDQSRGTIAGEGAIDVPEVREAIKKIMEGGEAAFNLRKEKYGF